MRCNNCGWDNSSNAFKCEKCNTAMQGVKDEQPAIANSSNTNSSLLDKTIKGAIPIAPFIDRPEELANSIQNIMNLECPYCGYPNPAETNVCLNCKKHLNIQGQTTNNEGDSFNTGMKTQTPWSKKNKTKFILLEIKDDNSFGNSIEFSGEQTILNRANTIQTNQTITSKEQALVEYKDGKWYISDRSALKTTFVCSQNPIEIQKGDIIMLGDTRFEFNM